jgi:hypothetical protein
MKIDNLRKFRLILLFISAVFVLSGCVTPEQKLLDSGMKPLTSQQYQVLFTKPQTATYVNDKGAFTVKYYPDGRQEVSSPMIHDTGTWRISNGKECSKWKTIRHGNEVCDTWFKVSEGKYEVYSSEGSKKGVLTFE